MLFAIARRLLFSSPSHVYQQEYQRIALHFDLAINKLPYTVGIQADICEIIDFQNLTVCVDTYICNLSFPKIAVLNVL
jgi:hypothetical protein